MRKINIVIIEDETELCELIKMNFENNFSNIIEIVGIAHDGVHGVELVKNVKPDIAIIDIVLPYKDGMSILKEIRGNYEINDTFCIMMSAIGKSTILSEAMDMGSDYFLIKPFDITSLGKKIISLYEKKVYFNTVYQNSRTALPDNNMAKVSIFPQVCVAESKEKNNTRDNAKEETTSEQNTEIVKLLRSMGIYHMNNGFYYLKYAINLCINEKRYLDGITKELYPTVAKAFKTTDSRVERSIRHLLKTSWENGAGSRYIETTGLPEEYKSKKPANGIFIHQLVEIYERRFY